MRDESFFELKIEKLKIVLRGTRMRREFRRNAEEIFMFVPGGNIKHLIPTKHKKNKKKCTINQ